MPKKLSFEGHSDDTFGYYGDISDDHDNCANGRPIVFKVLAKGEIEPGLFAPVGLYVVGKYAGNDLPDSMPGCWMVGVVPLGEDIPLPKWPMRFTDGESGYSPALVIDAPDDVTVECVQY